MHHESIPKKFQQDDTLVQYFINSCKSPYTFRPKHVERFKGINRILYKSVILLEFFWNTLSAIIFC
jgi:hypothetical protein